MPEVSSQVAAAHLEFIEPISAALAEPTPSAALRDAAMFMVAQYRDDGWHGLCDAVEARLAGRDAVLADLDDEDRQILLAIDRAVDEPQWLQRVLAEAQAEAADQVAALILAATWGEREALAALNEMRETAQAAGLHDSTAHAFVAMVEGERRLEALTVKYPNAQRGLIEATLTALTRREQDAG